MIFCNPIAQNKILKLIYVETRISTNFSCAKTICKMGWR
ncbi:protein of unknown function [Nitrosotalea devaniterrae]|uniref:Uncharacterized protein n=1 Tax=Nitrosotalea devaniterrae TaxID=1078905 RepID=A0A128A5B7_9ARCH|nr:protein of unknown function [Candidatus Nitrosotalea devanaterra]